MAKFGHATGADLRTFGGLAGIGNIMGACNSEHSSERLAGVRFAKGESLDEIVASLPAVESIHSIHAVFARAKQYRLSLSIISGLKECIDGVLPVSQLKEKLMSIPTVDEMAGISFEAREMIHG